MHPAVAQYRDEIARLCREYGVTRLEAFGSAARDQDFDPELRSLAVIASEAKQSSPPALDLRPKLQRKRGSPRFARDDGNRRVSSVCF